MRPSPPQEQTLMYYNPDLPGFWETWHGARGPAWGLFVQAGAAILLVLNVIAAVTIL